MVWYPAMALWIRNLDLAMKEHLDPGIYRGRGGGGGVLYSLCGSNIILLDSEPPLRDFQHHLGAF